MDELHEFLDLRGKRKPRYILVKEQNTKNTEKIFKAARENQMP